MSVLSILDSIGNSPVAQVVNGAEWAFPVVQSFHFLGFAFLIGTIAIVDLRVLGGGIKSQTPEQLSDALRKWTLIGVILMLTTGPIMFSADPRVYYFNPSFRFKMTWLLIAIAYHYTIHRWAIKPAAPAFLGKLAAVVSLALWTTVLAGGRFIAFV